MNNKGYSLLEVLVAMVLFLAVIVPLMGHMSSSARINRGKDKMVAACILEQEAAQLRLYPDEIFNTKRRNINGIEWIIKASFQGEQLKKCTLSVSKRGKSVDRVIFYLFDKEN